MTADKQQVLVGHGQKGRRLDDQWRRLTEAGQLVRRQQELGEQPVQGQNEGQREGEVWQAGDAENQETLCRQQQMLICELRRQLEQSRRALIEAQAGELKMAAAAAVEPPARRQDLARTSPVAQPSVAASSTDLRMSLGVPPGSLRRADVFALQHHHHLTSQSAQQQQLEQRETVADQSLSLRGRLSPPARDIQLRLQPTAHRTLVP